MFQFFADHDLLLVVGLLAGLFSIPSGISAWAEERPPRTASILALIGGGLIVFALTQKPGGYNTGQFFDAILSVISRFR